MTGEVVGQIIGSAGLIGAALASGFLVGRQSKKATAAAKKTEDRAADAKSYLAAREIDLSVVRELTERCDRLAAEVRDLRREVDEERRRSDKLEGLLTNERRKVHAITRAARNAGFPVPDAE